MQELSNIEPTVSDADAADLAAIDCADLVERGVIPEDATVDQLQEELAKWRERVPRLAAALRERTDESQRLQSEVERLRRSPSGTSSAASGTQEVLELEARLRGMSAKHADLEGQIRSRDLEIVDLREDVESLRNRCQGLTEALDESSALMEAREQGLDRARAEVGDLTELLDAKTGLVEEHEHELATLREEASSLADRNTKLFETTELASRQMESLGNSLEQLRDEIRRRDDQLDSMRGVLEGREQEVGSLEAKVAQLEGRLADSGSNDPQAQAQLRDELLCREQELDAMADSLADQRAEVKRLEGCVESAEQVTREREVERRRLSERIAELEDQTQRLNADLEESAARVGGLEQKLAARDEEQAAAASAEKHVEEENRRLSEALAKTERRAEDLSERTIQLDARLERQKDLMLNLEEELAETQDEYSAEQKRLQQIVAQRDQQLSDLKNEIEAGQGLIDDSMAEMQSAQDRLAELEQVAQPSADVSAVDELTRQVERELAAAKAAAEAGAGDAAAEVEVLQGAVHKLEQMVRDRTEQLNKLQWRHSMAAREDSAGADSGNKMLLVLNQQLTDARESNDRLSARIRELEQLTGAPES